VSAPKPREKIVNKLITKPETMGVTESKFVYTAQVKFANSSRLRCQYDCLAGEDKNTFHPPNTPGLEVSRDMLLEYRFGLLIRKEVPADPKPAMEEWTKFSDLILGHEKKAFLMGYVRAFVLAIGTCQYLHRNDDFRPCLYPSKKRPTFESVGVELLETLEMVAWHDYAQRTKDDPFQLFALLMLE